MALKEGLDNFFWGGDENTDFEKSNISNPVDKRAKNGVMRYEYFKLFVLPSMSGNKT